MSDRQRRRSPFKMLFRKGVTETILYLASREKARYSDIKKQKYVVGDRTLSRTLKELQRQDIIRREVLSTFPISTSYSLTEKGKAVARCLNELKDSLAL